MDLSARYANVNGTIYDKQTGQGFSTPQQFFQVSGVNTFNGLVFDTAWRPGQTSGTSTSSYSSPTPTPTSSTNVSSTSPLYGSQKNADLERQAADSIGTFFTTLKRAGSISQAAFDTTINNPQNMARYIQGWAYGGYTLDDIFREVKSYDTGQPIKAVDANMTAQQYYATSQYAAIKNNAALNPPLNSTVDPSLWNNPIFAIPGEAFKTLVPVIDVNSPQFKDEASKIQDAYYDLLIQQVEANTTQAKAIADDNYRMFKDQVAKQYGYKLADDAVGAWSQIQQLTQGASANNLLNSGIYNEALDKYLAQRRQTDQRSREAKMTEEEKAKRDYYLNSATPQQIANDLSDAEKKKWGLKPAQELMDFINSLRAKYPDLSDSDIAKLKDSLVDENGNLRSSLYNQLYSNKYNLTQEKTLTQQQTLLNQKLAESEKAYAPYSQAENPFLQYSGSQLNTSPVPTTTTAPTTTTFQGLQMPTTSFVKYVKTSSSPTVYGVTSDGKYVAFENPDQFLSSGGDWNNIQTVSSVPTSTNYSSYTSGTTTTQPTTTSTGLQMPSGYTASSPTTTTTTTSPTTTTKDLSGQYGLYNGTVYNLGTGYGYSTPDSFFKDAGITDFSQAKLDTSYQPKFYKYSNDPTVYNAYNNTALDYNSYLLSGGNPQFSGIETRTR